MTVQIRFDGKQAGNQFQARVKKYSEQQIKATQYAANKAKDEIERLGRANISKGGKFQSERWQAGFRATVQYLSRSGIIIRATHAVKYWRVFEFGATIKGKPMLWIPLSFASDAIGKSARDFGGKLFRVDRPGKAPLLMSDTGPKYFGKESVTIPRKWRLRETIRTVVKRLPAYYKEGMRNGK